MSDFTPEGFKPADDLIHERPDNTPNWSESYAFWAYWEGRYLYMHYQRHPDDSTMWRAYAAVQGEDGSNVVFHGFGREHSPFGPGYQQVHAICERPYEIYRVEVDAIGQVSDWRSLREHPMSIIDDRITPLKLDLQFTSVSATYAPIRGEAAGTSSLGSWTQYTPCKVQGYVTIGDERKYIDVLGYRDHSAGVRSFKKMSSGFMLTGILPSGRSYMAIGVGTKLENGDTAFSTLGGVTIDGKVGYATNIEVSDKIISTPEPGGDLGEVKFETEEHGDSVIKLRSTGAGIPFTNLPPNYEVIGWQRNPGDLVYHDWRVDIEWDGETGVGGWEPCILTD